ncbi:MAG: hypothetical protein ICV66_02825 [Chitinophagaceae bacterium]|nr:hypothetical protein [Chitinophagaceae bacterium]
MQRDFNTPVNPSERHSGEAIYGSHQNQTPHSSGGDDLIKTSPTDSRADEKVIVNAEIEHQAVNSISRPEKSNNQNYNNSKDTLDTGPDDDIKANK